MAVSRALEIICKNQEEFDRVMKKLNTPNPPTAKFESRMKAAKEMNIKRRFLDGRAY